MTAIALEKGSKLYRATIGKKVVMAVTGVIMALFLVGHMAGNLQIFAGATRLNDYSKLLHAEPALLWVVRLVLIASVVLHATAAIQLYSLKSAARPIAYAKYERRASSLPSRFMIWTGYALALFIVFHILHFTTGTLHPDFIEGDVFHNVTSAFTNPVIAVVYVVAMIFLSMHLYHGLWSFTQSLGVENPRYAAPSKAAAKVVAIVLAAGFIAVPVGVLAALAK
jgi:succinate dehydrogenase / fumarate reductase cytochrome b subunit